MQTTHRHLWNHYFHNKHLHTKFGENPLISLDWCFPNVTGDQPSSLFNKVDTRCTQMVKRFDRHFNVVHGDLSKFTYIYISKFLHWEIYIFGYIETKIFLFQIQRSAMKLKVIWLVYVFIVKVCIHKRLSASTFVW